MHNSRKSTPTDGRSPQGHIGKKIKLENKRGHRRSASDARRQYKRENQLFMCGELSKFISNILEREVSPDFMSSLGTGIELCDLLEKVTLGEVKVPKIHRRIGNKAMDKVKYGENIEKFTKTCMDIGIDPTDLCTTSCFEGGANVKEGNLDPILNNLYALLGLAYRNGIEIPDSLLSKVKEVNLNAVKKKEPEPEPEIKKPEPKIEPFPVFVEINESIKIEVFVLPTDNVLRIKELTCEKTSIPMYKQKINEYLDYNTIEQSGITEGLTIQMTVDIPKIKPLGLWASVTSMLLAVVGMICAIIALSQGEWALLYDKNGKEIATFGMFGYYKLVDKSYQFVDYSTSNGWDAATGNMGSVGWKVAAFVGIAIFFSACTFVALITKDFAVCKRMTGGKTWGSFIALWLQDHIYLLSVLAGCTLVISTVMWSYLASPYAYAYGRFLKNSTHTKLTYGPSFLCCIVAAVAALGAGVVLHFIRFYKMATRLEESSARDMRLSTYGSIEIVLENEKFKKQTCFGQDGCC